MGKDLVLYREKLIVHRIEDADPWKQATALFVLPADQEMSFELFKGRSIGISSFLESRGVSLQEAIRHFPGDIIPGGPSQAKDSSWGVSIIEQRIPLNEEGLGRLATISKMPLSLYVSLGWPIKDMPKLVAQFIPHLQRPHRDYL